MKHFVKEQTYILRYKLNDIKTNIFAFSNTSEFFRLDSQIPYFCGSDDNCLTFGDPKASQKAIESIEKNFVVVGIMEEMNKSVAVMECLIPDFLTGFMKIRTRFSANFHKAHKNNVPLNNSAREEMENRMANEYVVYNYVKQRLNEQYLECVKSGRIRNVN